MIDDGWQRARRTRAELWTLMGLEWAALLLAASAGGCLAAGHWLGGAAGLAAAWALGRSWRVWENWRRIWDYDAAAEGEKLHCLMAGAIRLRRIEQDLDADEEAE